MQKQLAIEAVKEHMCQYNYYYKCDKNDSLQDCT